MLDLERTSRTAPNLDDGASCIFSVTDSYTAVFLDQGSGSLSAEIKFDKFLLVEPSGFCLIRYSNTLSLTLYCCQIYCGSMVAKTLFNFAIVSAFFSVCVSGPSASFVGQSVRLCTETCLFSVELTRRPRLLCFCCREQLRFQTGV